MKLIINKITVKKKLTNKLIRPMVIEIDKATSVCISKKLYPAIMVSSLMPHPPKLTGKADKTIVIGPTNKLCINRILLS